MEQRKSARRRSSDGTSNRNMRSINNSREVSRRAKGKNRYAYEEDRRSARYYDDEEDDEYYKQKEKKTIIAAVITALVMRKITTENDRKRNHL